MGLKDTTGFTDDGLVFVQFEGQQDEFGRPIKTVITIEPDHAESLGKRILDAAEKAQRAKNRPLIVPGEPVTIKRG
jgi:hypothetical protein